MPLACFGHLHFTFTFMLLEDFYLKRLTLDSLDLYSRYTVLFIFLTSICRNQRAHYIRPE